MPSADREKVISFDMDGVMVGREVGMQMGALLRYLTMGPRIYKPTSSIGNVGRLMSKKEIVSPAEWLSFWVHSGREVRSGIRKYLGEHARTHDMYVNTDRWCQFQWVEMTKDTLRRGGVLDYFAGFFFRPYGVGTMESKGAAIQKLSRDYDEVTHFDNNPAVVLPLAKLFPWVHFVIVKDWSTWLLLTGVSLGKDYKNVNVARLSRRGRMVKVK